MLPEHAHAVYALVTLLAIGVGLAGFERGARDAGLPIGRGLALFAGVTVAAHVGGRLYLTLETVGWSGVSLGVLGPGSYRLPGAVLGALVAIPLLRAALVPALPLGRVADALVPGGALGFATMRLGCFAVGCCHGVVSGLPWAVRFPPGSTAAGLHERLGLVPPGAGSLPVHPLQLYFLALGLATAALAVWLAKRKTFDGQVLCAAILLHEGGKALLELLRQPDPLVPTGHLVVVSAAMAVAGAVGLVRGLRASVRGPLVTASRALLLLAAVATTAHAAPDPVWTDTLVRYARDPLTGWREVVRLDDGRPEALGPFELLALADAHLRAARPQRARELFDLLVARNMGEGWDDVARLGSGWAALAAGDDVAARAGFTHVASASARLRGTALVVVGMLDAAEGDLDAARANLGAAATEPGSPPELRAVATVAHAMSGYWAGRYAEAATDLEAAAQRLPSRWADDAWFAAGQARWRAGDREGALRIWRRLAAPEGARGSRGSSARALAPRGLLRSAVRRYRRMAFQPPDRLVAAAIDADGAGLARAALSRAGRARAVAAPDGERATGVRSGSGGPEQPAATARAPGAPAPAPGNRTPSPRRGLAAGAALAVLLLLLVVATRARLRRF